jgi:hypothetical protein
VLGSLQIKKFDIKRSADPKALEGQAMFPGMAWELDTKSRGIALDEAIRAGQLEREAMVAREDQDKPQAARRRWLDRLGDRVATWVSAGTSAGRGTTSPSTH